MASSNHDIIVLTETWLSDSVKDGEIFHNRYSVVRKDRNRAETGKKTGGGSLIASKHKFSMTVIDCPSHKYDAVVVKLYIDYCYIYLCVVYFPPVPNSTDYEDFFQSVETIIPLGSTILLMGDFNLTAICGPNFGTLPSCTTYQNFLNFVNFYNLIPFNNITNKNGRTLDLVLSNLGKVQVSRDECPLLPEDDHHPALIIFLALSNTKVKEKSSTTKYDFSRADYPLLYKELETTNWQQVINSRHPDDAVDIFYKIMYAVLDKCVPKKVIQHKYPVWFTKQIITLIKRKSYHHKKKKLSDHTLDYHCNKFRELRSTIKKAISKAYEKYVKNTESNILTNPKFLWSYVRNKARGSDVNTFEYEGKILRDDISIANAFKTQFERTFSNSSPKYDLSIHPTHNWSHLVDNLSFDTITLQEVENAIKTLRPRCSPGSDLIPPYIFKGCSESLKIPLQAIFNLSRTTACFPVKWKVTNISPIPKGTGRNSKIENYRPIALISTPAKIFESIVYNRIFKHVQPVLSQHQHGFIPGRSTVTNLTEFTHNIATEMHNKKQVDVIYTDFTKAFDLVDHDILLSKLATFNVIKEFRQFLGSYLSGRQQRVNFRHAISDNYLMRSGVPQGSKLGPLLFLLYINDLPNIFVHSHKLLYADDLKIYKTISCVSDAMELQKDLDSLSSWCQSHKLLLNPAKCKLVTYTTKKTFIDFQYTINSFPVTRVETIQDLGVTIDSNLSFGKHICLAVREAYRSLGFIIRISRDFQNFNAIITLYNAYVLSKLEYAAVIWDPHLKTQILQLEKIQSKFVRFLTYKETGFYPQFEHYQNLIQNFSLDTLENKRKQHLLMFLHKLLHNIHDSDTLRSQLNFHIPDGRTRNQNKTFHLSIARSNVLNESPIRKMCYLYNRFQASSPDIDIFDASVSRFRICVKGKCISKD